MIPTRQITSVSAFVTAVIEDSRSWEPAFPWFRGEPGDARTPLTPMVFRPPTDGHHFDENNLLQSFRRKAHLIDLPPAPAREAIDQWLFLARHVGLPTRLLDWTESALIGLFFALCDSPESSAPVVWMLNPHRLNLASDPSSLANVFPITWAGDSNPAYLNIRAAWQLGSGAAELPVAVEPTAVHPRIRAQHSYFTVHGSRPLPISDLVGEECLRRYEMHFPSPAMKSVALKELRRLGISRFTILPDAEALSSELSQLMIVQDRS